MNRSIVVICLMVCSLIGCRPRGVLSSPQMEQLLYELHRADGVLHVSGYHYDQDSVLSASYALVLDKYGVTQAEFDSSLVWYTDNPQLFNKIYPHVLERLEKDLGGIDEAIRPSLSTLPAVRPVLHLDELLKRYREGLPIPVGWGNDSSK